MKNILSGKKKGFCDVSAPQKIVFGNIVNCRRTFLMQKKNILKERKNFFIFWKFKNLAMINKLIAAV